MTFDEFIKDRKTIEAVIRRIEIMGEASKNISPEIREKYNEVEWSEMSRARDKIIHWYFEVNYKIIWELIKNKLPILKPKIIKIISDLNLKAL